MPGLFAPGAWGNPSSKQTFFLNVLEKKIMPKFFLNPKLYILGRRRRCGPVGMVMLLLSSRADCSPARIPAGPEISLKLAVSEVITYTSHKGTGRSLELTPACEPKKNKLYILGRKYHAIF